MNCIQTPSEKIGLNYREIIILTINLIYSTKNTTSRACYAILREQCKRIVFSRIYRVFSISQQRHWDSIPRKRSTVCTLKRQTLVSTLTKHIGTIEYNVSRR